MQHIHTLDPPLASKSGVFDLLANIAGEGATSVPALDGGWTTEGGRGEAPVRGDWFEYLFKKSLYSKLPKSLIFRVPHRRSN